ncbi:hypothetical protein NQ318_002071 [Aromia moschata]|uniref:Uncharacterized protein n=1 Tax=Aromia moschata TaxID=1265417 RepID=A0AAV8Z436_9CUCU|nr:hypothetical protein NQ318_002071 [Aromia moschata]
MGTALTTAISSGVLWRINKGLPRHLNVTCLPSGISSKFISILANARTSAVADIEETRLEKKKNWFFIVTV